MPFFDPEVMGASIGRAMESTEALLFGRRTWRVMADAWPNRAGDEFADHMNSIKKYVASRTLTEADLDWNNTSLLPADDAIGADLIPTLTDLDAARTYDDAAARRARPADVFVKVDVGLERLGVPADQAVKLVLAIRDLAGLRLAGLCTHLHVPTGADPAYVEWQFGRFTAVLDALATQGVDVPIRLAASSPLVLGFPSTYLNAVDPGRMLYGYGHEAVAGPVVLRPTFRAFKSRLVEVKDLTPRERFAAAAPFPITAAMRLGVIPAGMGDGVHRLNAGEALVRGRRVPILARPSLEHTRLDLTTVPDAVVGDEVVLVGRQGAEEITLDEIAECHTIDLLALALGVGPRVARVYVGSAAAGRADEGSRMEGGG